MSHDDNTLTNKLSPLIGTQLPEFIQADHPVFSQFVRSYYEFMESAEITFSEVNNYLVQETTSKNFVLDENDDNIVLEDSEAKFTVGETITGLTSGATAKVLVDDVDDNKRLFISSQTQFIIGETVTGSTSNSSGTVQTYRANPVQNIQQLLEFGNVDSTVYKFLDNFRDAFLDGVVDDLVDGVDKRSLTKNIRDLYIAKGTKKGHELFFRLLFNDDAVITYPNENMLRSSDGVWTTRRIMRIQEVSGDTAELIGQTITGQTSSATAIITSTIGIRENFTDIVEIEIDTDTQTGTFQAGETVKGTSSVTDADVSFTLYSIVNDVTVSNTDEGQYYTTGQKVNIASAGSTTATAEIGVVGTGRVDNILIDNAGSNYLPGDAINFDNTGTDGNSVSAEVAVVGGAIAPESGDVAEYGMELTDHITLEDETQIFMGDSFHGTKIVLEDDTFADLGVSAEKGSITDVRLINKGDGYTKLPTISSITTTSGTGAKLLPISKSGVGAVKDIKITNVGFNYSSAPAFNPFRHVIIKDITGTFSVDDALTSHTGTVSSYDSDRQLLSLNTTASLSDGDTITTSGASATIAQVDTPTVTPTVGTIAVTSGEFLGERGKASSDVMRIQDSFFYQDYSYVVRVGESINTWRNAIKRTVHPAGWAVFGEVSIVTSVKSGVKAQDVTSFSPELASLFRTIFSSIFGRRLGTLDDGTTLRATPSVASDSILSDGERDLTLERINSLTIGSVRANVKLGIGPTLENLPKYAFAVPEIRTDSEIPHYPGLRRKQTFGGFNDNAYYNIEQFANIRINQVSVKEFSFDQTNSNDKNERFDSDGHATFDDAGSVIIPQEAFTTKINVPPPGEIVVSTTSKISGFDAKYITFDMTDQTFDESGTPRDIAGLYKTDFSDNTITFDSGTSKFDEEHTPLATTARFDSGYVKFDSGTAKFDSSENALFSSNAFKFDSNSKTFDIG